jgi:hypothetical protein
MRSRKPGAETVTEARDDGTPNAMSESASNADATTAAIRPTGAVDLTSSRWCPTPGT